MTVDGLLVLDAHYIHDGFCSTYAWIREGKVFLVEINTNQAAEHILATLKRDYGISTKDVEGLIITHVHLDHAGGAGLFSKLCPQAKVYAHPRAARHLRDPSRLVASAKIVYGEENFRALYGEILPVPEVIELADESDFEWRGLKFFFKHTRGHANHHGCVWEKTKNVLFSGDSFGVSYPSVCSKGRLFLPSTSPTDFDGEAALLTVNWVRTLAPAYVGLAHYGLVPHVELSGAADQLEFFLRDSIAVLGELNEAALVERQWKKILEGASVFHYTLVPNAREFLKLDIEINAQGLAYVAKSRKN